MFDNFKQIIEIQHANHSRIAECQGSEEKEKRPFNCWSYKTEFEVRSSLIKESLRRKVSYGYEDNRRRRDWLVVRIRSLSEYKNGYFLLQRTNQRHSELACYWPACKQRVESIKANVREKNIMSLCLIRCKVQDFSQLSIYITCSKYNPWKSCHFRNYFLHVHYSNCKHSCVDRLFNHGVSSLFFFLITRLHFREESLYRLPGKTILQFPLSDPDEIAAKSREGHR